LKIMAKCSAPRYAKGEYEFRSFEKVFDWLVKIRGFPKGGVGRFLFALAKDGHIDGVYTAHYSFEMESDFHDYFLAQEVARKTGLLYSFDRLSPKLDIALAFAKTLDKEVKR